MFPIDVFMITAFLVVTVQEQLLAKTHILRAQDVLCFQHMCVFRPAVAPVL